MVYAEFNGRLQNLTVGRLDDLRVTYDLATLPRTVLTERVITPETMLFKDGQHSKLSERIEEMPLLGELEGMVIGIGGADPPQIPPEQVLPEWENTAKRFFDPKTNPLTYFERMLLLKKLLIETASKDNPIDLSKIDFTPKFPHHFYPSVVGEFELLPGQLAFQYFGVEVDRHWQRIHTKGPDGRSIICVYRDHRQEDNKERGVNLITPEALAEIRRTEYLILCDYFISTDEGELPDKERIEGLLELGQKVNDDVVFGIKCDPRDSDKDIKEKAGVHYEDKVKIPSFQRYLMLKSYLRNLGVDWKRTHLTFAPPADRELSYLPIFNNVDGRRDLIAGAYRLLERPSKF